MSHSDKVVGPVFRPHPLLTLSLPSLLLQHPAFLPRGSRCFCPFPWFLGIIPLYKETVVTPVVCMSSSFVPQSHRFNRYHWPKMRKHYLLIRVFHEVEWGIGRGLVHHWRSSNRDRITICWGHCRRDSSLWVGWTRVLEMMKIKKKNRGNSCLPPISKYFLKGGEGRRKNAWWGREEVNGIQPPWLNWEWGLGSFGSDSLGKMFSELSFEFLLC